MRAATESPDPEPGFRFRTRCSSLDAPVASPRPGGGARGRRGFLLLPLTGRGYDATLPAIVSAPLKLYVKSWCPWCITARQYLVKRGFRFEEIDVESDRAAYAEMIRLSGQTYTPTLSVEDKLLADFGPDELQVFLHKHHIEP